MVPVDQARIRELLAPFLPAPLTDAQLAQISTYLDVLLRWNARMNLTAVRHPDQIVTRHFGESLFAAARLFPTPPAPGASLLDFGSGAGFPGLPIKIFVPPLRVTLLESQNKKATFLREVMRALRLTDVNVHAGRAEDFDAAADVVTFRAVERFDQALPAAAPLLAPAGRLALLIGAAQEPRARHLLPHFTWDAPLPIPLSSARILLLGTGYRVGCT